MNIDEDTSTWLGCPTPLEMYKHQCAMLEDELTTAYQLLKQARANIAGLVQMNDLLATEKAAAESQLRSVSADLSRVHVQGSEMSKQIMSLKIIASQNEHLHIENQRLLLELSVLRGPQP
ncbi:hypothetical protein [Pseudomonas tolaasii]|uniref:hypothetical protein n=1 Tax=Pseudomonas tolaasii TaxID=29442 RepID=UPI0015A2A594|nr:hypothetical protein [Pseudomonas tolaasii]NWC30674.1 hypothetical protein [Pseudomonas tolaasii]NWE66647.1 hypothetical protein [Pseudomonas tolaasii]